MIGIVDMGGGLRGAFGAGVFDYCLARKIHFPYCIGVSAGSANIASYLAGQKGRNLVFYTDYAQRRQYMSLANFLLRGSYIDLDYVYSTLANEGGENPLDYDALQANPATMKIVATDAETGTPVYLDKGVLRRNAYDALKASSCLPVVCRPYRLQGRAYFDGGISDPIPVEKALADGCTRVAVILTRPVEIHRTPGNDPAFARLIRRRYPRSAEALLRRHETYNAQIRRIRQLEAENRACILAPNDCCGVKTLTRDKASIMRLYQKGYETARKLDEFL